MTKTFANALSLVLLTLSMGSAHAKGPVRGQGCGSYKTTSLIQCNLDITSEVGVSYEIEANLNYDGLSRNGRCTGGYIQTTPSNGTLRIELQVLDKPHGQTVRAEKTLVKKAVLLGKDYRVKLDSTHSFAEVSALGLGLNFKKCGVAIPSGISIGN